ncbi:hypothetical protein D3C80_1390400 [compost metagenome]
MAEHVQYARCQLVLAVIAGRIAHHAFVFSQLLVEMEGVVPLELVGHVGLLEYCWWWFCVHLTALCAWLADAGSHRRQSFRRGQTICSHPGMRFMHLWMNFSNGYGPAGGRRLDRCPARPIRAWIQLNRNDSCLVVGFRPAEESGYAHACRSKPCPSRHRHALYRSPRLAAGMAAQEGGQCV